MNFRNLRVANVIREELGKIILRELEFPDAVVTITDVVIDPKLEGAAVRVSVLPSDKEDMAFKELEKHKLELQHLLSRTLNIRPMPHIRFEADHGLENAARVEKALLDDSRAQD
jgi:ribosome-binding factor A